MSSIYIQSFYEYVFLLHARDFNMSRLTCIAILRLIFADFTSSERLSVRINLLGI